MPSPMPDDKAPNPYQRPRRPIKSDVGWSDKTTIQIYGMDLPNDLLGKVTLGDMAHLSCVGKHDDASLALGSVSTPPNTHCFLLPNA